MRLPFLSSTLTVLVGFLSARSGSGFSVQQSLVYEAIRTSSSLLDPITGESSSPSLLLNSNKKSLVVLLPQLGEFDSSEYCEFLVAAQTSLTENDVELFVIGIGDTVAAQEFCNFTGLSPTVLRIDPDATLYKELDLYSGPNFSVSDVISDGVLRFFLNQLPGGIPDDETQLRPVATAWLNYLAMCTGIGAPGTIREILRGYFGDTNAPERLCDDDIVKAGFITIGPGVGPVQIGSALSYNQYFADEKGYQRPFELATVRLKNMVEVLTKWDKYVSNPVQVAQRGATFLFDVNGSELYSYKSRGVLTYSETMPRPLSFLAPYIGEEIAFNPLGLFDNGGGEFKRGRGILKPVGKAMTLLSFLFKLENRLQAKLLGVEDGNLAVARKEIEQTISDNTIVVYTYRLSPFSQETLAVLDEIGVEYKNVEVGLEWFLLGKEPSALRAALLEMTGQSSLPQVFIKSQHVGGLFTGTLDQSFPGLAGLKESGDLQKMIA